jgi:5-methylcytosine-specific restriction endonuclease McrA
MRFLIMRRDTFRCCISGAVQNVGNNISLEVDHIVPWGEGGETIEQNLHTLCNRCNGGKSNLPKLKK